MDDTEDDARYPPNPSSSSYYASNYHHHRRPKLPVRNTSSVPPIPKNYYNEQNNYNKDDNDDEEEEEEEEDNYNEGGNYHDDNGEEDEEEEEDDDDVPIHRAVHEAEDEEEEENEEDDGDDDDDDDDDDDNDINARYRRPGANDDSGPPRKRPHRMDKSALAFEFAPRVKPVPAPPAPAAVAKPSFGGPRGSPIADWTEHSTFTLLDAWGDRFLQLGRKSLRSDDWVDVAKQVSQVSRAVRTDAQCRNRLDTLKKKYKREKMKVSESGNPASKWVYFKKMEELMSGLPPPRQQPGLSCGVDSGEYVFMNPRVYLNRANGLDEMRDSPGNSEEDEDDEDDEDGLPPKRVKLEDGDEGGGPSSSSSFRMLADSIQKFGEIYEKIEDSKRQQMEELERMRMEFHRDLELQKRQILERAQAEIAKIREGDGDEEIDVSVENISG